MSAPGLTTSTSQVAVFTAWSAVDPSSHRPTLPRPRGPTTSTDPPASSQYVMSVFPGLPSRLDADHLRFGVFEYGLGQLPDPGPVALGQLAGVDRSISLEVENGRADIEHVHDMQRDIPPFGLPSRMSQCREARLGPVDSHNHRPGCDRTLLSWRHPRIPKMAAIEVTGLRKSYGDVVAVDGVDISVETGEVFALLGPNGAGKTTTVEILEGHRSADGGSISVLGLRPLHRRPGLPGANRDRPPGGRCGTGALGA